MWRSIGCWAGESRCQHAAAKAKLSESQHTHEAAEYLDVHHNTIRKWAGRGDLPMHRNPVNGYRLFKQTGLDSLLTMAAKTVTASAIKNAQSNVVRSK